MTVARQAVVPVELAEAAAEGDVLLARDLLVAEQQDAALEEGAVDPVELGVAERLGEIDALDLGAQAWLSGRNERDMGTYSVNERPSCAFQKEPETLTPAWQPRSISAPA